MVSGGTQAGKTTLSKCLCAAIPAGERVISVEEPNLEGKDAIQLRRLGEEALRMRPSRIIGGEVCQDEALDPSATAVNGRRLKPVFRTAFRPR